MSEPPESYSSKKAGNTRVKVKERKKTVGITLSWDLVKAARKLRINISQFTENCLRGAIEHAYTSIWCGRRDSDPGYRLGKPKS